MNVVRYAGPSRKESAEPLGICSLSKRASIWYFNNFANLDKQSRLKPRDGRDIAEPQKLDPLRVGGEARTKRRYA